MFAARGTVHRNLLNVRTNHDRDEDEIINEEDDNLKEQNEGQEVEVLAKPVVSGDTSTVAAEPGTPKADESEDDGRIRPLSLDGLVGVRRKYVQISNITIATLNTSWFNSLVMLCISWASLSVGLQTYESLSSNVILDDLDYFVLSVFILECILKIIAEGLTPWVFFTGKEMRWNCFDFAIIIMSLPMWGSALGGSNIAILRMLRLLRIMKLVKRIPQLYMIIMGLVGGLKSIGYIFLLLLLVFYLYAISGMYAWQNNDAFHFRNVPIAMVTLFRMSTLENWSNVMNINYFGCDRFQGGYYSFNESDADRFQFCNVTALYGENATESSISSQRFINGTIATFYFITFILISAFVMLSLIIGAITMGMTQSMEQMKAAQEEAETKRRMEKIRKRALEAQQREQELAERKKTDAQSGVEGSTSITDDKGLSSAERKNRKQMRDVLLQTWDDCDLTDILTQTQGDTNSLKGRYLLIAGMAEKLVEHPKFSLFVTGVIILAGLLVGLQTSSSIVDAMGEFLTALDSVILAVFTVEVILKVLAEALEPWMYFSTAWNTFDFIIVVGSFLKGSGGMLTMLRLLRLLRVLKLVRAFPQLQIIVSALMKGVGSIGYIGLIMFLCFYVFGIVGNMLFAENDPFHFGNLHYAMISLFQMATMDGWSDVLYINYYGCDQYGYDDYLQLGYTCTPKAQGLMSVLYFCSFIVIGGMVLITLFIGVVTTSMEETTQEMEAEKELLRRVEVLRVRKNLEQNVVDSYMQVFRMLDLDNSGSVEEAELRIGLAAIGKNPSYHELKEMMDVVDEDGSGQIDIVEFVEFMVHVREKSNEQKMQRQAQLAAEEAAKAAALGASTTANDDDDGVNTDERSCVRAFSKAEEDGDDKDGDEGGNKVSCTVVPPNTKEMNSFHGDRKLSHDHTVVIKDEEPVVYLPLTKESSETALLGPPSTAATPRTSRSHKSKIVPSG